MLINYITDWKEEAIILKYFKSVNIIFHPHKLAIMGIPIFDQKSFCLFGSFALFSGIYLSSMATSMEFKIFS